MHRKRARRILGILKKSVELCLVVRRRRVTFACSPRPCGGCHTCWGGGRWKSQNKKNVYLFPYVEEPLNSKVIKSFVPELRSCKCFSCFGIPMFYVYMLQTFYVRFAYSCMAMLYVILWPISNLESLTSQVRLSSTFICTVFKSHIEWNNAQGISAPSTTLRPTMYTFHDLNCFGHVI